MANFVNVFWTVVIFIITTSKGSKVYEHGVSLPTNRPLNIAHRGSSGTHPEHTIAAYEQAIDDGADVIECDVHVTKDLQLVCLHDAFLTKVTDVKSHSEFSRRKHAVDVPEAGIMFDWFVFDFTLKELKTLRVNQREPYRDPSYNGAYDIPTVQEFITVAQSAARIVGIYPEIKTPAFLNALPILKDNRIEDLLLDLLEKNGYNSSDAPCFIQSFDPDALTYLSQMTSLPLVVLVWSDEQVHGPHLNESRLEEWGQRFYGIGVWKSQVINYHNYKNQYKNWVSGHTSLVTDAQAEGLRVHVYTFRNEDQFLAWDFGQDPSREYELFSSFHIHGYFTDFPKTFNRFLDTVYGRNGPHAAGSVSGAMRLDAMGIINSLILFCFCLIAV